MSNIKIKPFLKRYGLVATSLWTIVICSLAALTLNSHHANTIKDAENEARDYFRLNMFYRTWAAKMGGVYVPVEKVAPNPYLTVPNRDITTSDNRQLTLVNPAYMTRMVFESIIASSPDPIINKITSIKPLNPINAPDDWEKQSLEAFERKEYKERYEVTNISGKPYLRLISMFITDETCLKCHAQQGYRKGDVRGAITISVPLSKRFGLQKDTGKKIIGGYLMLWLLGSVGITVTSRRRSLDEESLRASEQKFRTVCDWTQDWEYWVAPDGSMKYVSPSCFEITGYSQDEFMNDSELLPRIIYSDSKSAFHEHYTASVTPALNAAELIEFQIVTKSGDIRWIQHLCRPIFEGTVFLGRRSSNRDITDRKRAANDRLEFERQLMQTQKLESLGVLAGGIAHDFNNILTSIMGNADLALTRINKESPATDNLRRVLEASTRAADLARQMLAYSGKGKFLVENIDMNLLVEEMTHMLEVSISKKAVLRLNLHQPLPSVEADATQLHQVIMNLVINASEAIGDKSGVIAISTGYINCDQKYLQQVQLHEHLSEGLYVYLEIADTGCGMNKDTLSKIFDPFFTTKFTGRGLGMAAVLGIIRGHKGAIKVYSELGKGTTFKVLLPASNLLQEPFNGIEHPDHNWHGSGTVLLVDDEETVLGIGSEMLRELGFDVITASDGQLGVIQFREKQEKIDFVILDLTMPHMDGEQCFRELRQIKPDVKVIMSSGFSELEVTQKFTGKGLAGFIQKPYRLSVLKEAIQKI